MTESNAVNVQTNNWAAKAPRKLILFGEHSVLYDHPAIAIPLEDLSVTCSVRSPPIDDRTFCIEIGKSIQVQSWSLTFLEPLFEREGEFDLSKPVGPSQSKLELLKKICPDEVKRSPFFRGILHLYSSLLVSAVPLVVAIEHEFPCGGLGGSAAVAVTLAACLLQFQGCLKNSINEATRSLISAWAYTVETVTHGKASGIDNTVTTFGSSVVFQSGLMKRNLKIHEDIEILLVDSGVTRNTNDLVERLKAYHTNFGQIAKGILEEMGKVAQEAETTLTEIGLTGVYTPEAYEKLKNLIRTNQGLLYALGVSHPKIDEIVHIANQHGVAAKLSGAGGGGVVYMLLPPPYFEDRKQLLSTILNGLCDAGFSTKLISFHSPRSSDLQSAGVKVVK